jgi:colicin import membrane protein
MSLLGSGGLVTPDSMFSSEWRKPLNLSIGLHILVVAFAMLAPSIFHNQPKLPEIYTVNLYTATEVAEVQPGPEKAPVPQAANKPAARQIEPETPKPAVSIQPTEPETSPAVETNITEPISLEPLKQKIKVGKTKEEEALEKKILNQGLQRIKARAEEKAAREKADQAAREAVSKLTDALKTTTGAATSEVSGKVTTEKEATEGAGASGPRGTGIEPDFYMKQYFSAVYQKIHDNWVLPDLQNWDNSLEAVLVITIRKDGTIADSYFERKSDNIYFNQFVLKAIKDSSPLPSFPEQLGENTLEIGLRFKPGELY